MGIHPSILYSNFYKIFQFIRPNLSKWVYFPPSWQRETIFASFEGIESTLKRKNLLPRSKFFHLEKKSIGKGGSGENGKDVS